MQMENIVFVVVQYFLVFSLSGLYLVFIVYLYQIFKQIQYNLCGSIFFYFLWVECIWVVMIVVMKDLLWGEWCVGGNVSSVERSCIYQVDQL